MSARLGIRWTVGEVSRWGFTALRLSIWGARAVFGDRALYRVVVNTLSPEEARRRSEPLPPGVGFEAARDLPVFLRRELGGDMAEGVAWKLAPLRLFPELHELALDNDCILWSEPGAVRRWLDEPASGLLAEDVAPALGRFGAVLGPLARNSGMRGLPPGFDLEDALRAALRESPGPLRSELDEQGLQALALLRRLSVHVVAVDEVTICSPFPPHRPGPGRSGVHLVGLNAHRLGFEVGGRGAEELTREHFERLLPELRRRVGLPEAVGARRTRERGPAPDEEGTWPSPS